MRPTEHAADESPSSEPEVPGLEDLIPIAVVIGAGCERCTESLVQRARWRGTPQALIARTLGIVARVCSVECFVRAVGPEVIGGMRGSLQAGKEALRQAPGRVKDGGSCG
ncbi:MAG TPA: hypothetical protein VJU18_19775 [Vicinamibacteria bacterium]|nr:hypothetical protein [Vicinamibacteria bacterium]